MGVLSFAASALSFCTLMGTMGLALFEASRPVLAIVDVNTLTGFESLQPEHFRGLAIYLVGLLNGAMLAYKMRRAPAATEMEKPVDVAQVDAAPVAEEAPVPPPPMEPHPDDVAQPTPRTLLKNVLGDADENVPPPPPTVHTPTVMSVDDYEVLKKEAKGTTKRRKSFRTPKKVEAFSPS